MKYFKCLLSLSFMVVLFCTACSQPSSDTTDTTDATDATYTVTYVDGVDGAEIAVPSDTNRYKAGDSVTVNFTGVGSRTGYTFAGWSDGTTSYTSSGTTTFTMGSANVTLTAQWNPISYSVTYVDGVDGVEIIVPKDTTQYHIGDTVTVNFTGVGSRTGYTFAGWSDGSTTYTSSGTTTFTMGNANVTLTAQWRNIVKSRPDAVGDIVLNDGKAIAYADFSAMTEAQKASAIALIFYKGTGLNNGTDTTTSRILGVGLKQNKTGLAWCLNTANAYNRQLDQIQYVYSEESWSFTTIGDKNGSGTFGKISAFLSNLTDGTTDDTTTAGNYPAFEFAKQYKTVEGSRVSGTSFEEGWYLPSYAELTEIFTNGKGVNKVFDIDTALQALGGDKFEENAYRSSSPLTWISSIATDTHSTMLLFGDDWGGILKDNTTFYDSGSESNKPGCVCCIREF